MDDLIYDRVALDSIEVEDGELVRSKAVVGRVGVQKYRDSNGNWVNVFRDEAEIAANLEAFHDLPLTVQHPEIFISLDNTTPMVGYASKVELADGLLKTNLTITNKEVANEIKKYLRNKKEKQPVEKDYYFSIGYKTNLVKESGVWKDEKGWLGVPGIEFSYDYKQKGYKGNHISIVDTPRAGNVATFITDSFFPDETIINIDIMSEENKASNYEKELAEIKDSITKLVSEVSSINSRFDQEKEAAVNDAVEETRVDLKAEIAFYTETSKFASQFNDGFVADYEKSKTEYCEELLKLVNDGLPSTLTESDAKSYTLGFIKAYNLGIAKGKEEKASSVSDSAEEDKEPSPLSIKDSAPITKNGRVLREINGQLIW